MGLYIDLTLWLKNNNTQMIFKNQNHRPQKISVVHVYALFIMLHQQ